MTNKALFPCPNCKTRLSAPAEREERDCPFVRCPKCHTQLDLGGLDPAATKWYFVRDKAKLGPYSTEAMKWCAITEPRRLAPHDLVQTDGMATPVKASEVMEFFPPPQEWYIVRDKIKYGPYSTERMKGFVKDSILQQTDLVHTPGKLTSAALVEQLFPAADKRSRNGTIYSKKGMIYLIKVSPWNGCYKIGKTIGISPDSGFPEVRLKQLGVLLPAVPELIHHIETNNVDYAERHWHLRFGEKWTNGEWFRLDNNDVEEFSRCLEMVFDTDNRKEFFVVARCKFSLSFELKSEEGTCLSTKGHLTHPQGIRRP